jgi:hypothetical protein
MKMIQKPDYKSTIIRGTNNTILNVVAWKDGYTIEVKEGAE